MNERESPANRPDETAQPDAVRGDAGQPGSGQPGSGQPGSGQPESGQPERGPAGSEPDAALPVDYAEHAERAEFAEFAEHAEFAEFAEHVEHVEHIDHPAEADSADHAAQHHRRLLGLGRADGPPEVLWRTEMLHLIDQAATRLQATGRMRLRRPDRPEPRWPVTASVVVAILLQQLLPKQLALNPRFLLPAFEVALLIGLIAANPIRIERHSRPIRSASVTMILLITAANAISAVLLVKAIVTNDLGVSANHLPIDLLATGAAIWGTNVIAFALWYWEFDRGGPVHRLEGTSPYPDLLFPQMTSPELTPQGWGPRFVDYLYMSFTNATAFSPTDVMPMARWAKLTMLVQSAVSLAVGALVVARAVNILH